MKICYWPGKLSHDTVHSNNCVTIDGIHFGKKKYSNYKKNRKFRREAVINKIKQLKEQGKIIDFIAESIKIRNGKVVKEK